MEREDIGDAELVAELHALRAWVEHVEGSVVASTDGMLIAFDLGAAETFMVEPATLAALAAVNLGLSQRIADTASHGDFSQTLIRATFGIVVTYAVGDGALLSVLAKPEVDLDKLQRVIHQVLPRVVRLLEDAARATPLS